MIVGKVVGLLLAAGESSRFGSDKRLLQLPDGRTMIETSLSALIPHCDSTLVCLPFGWPAEHVDLANRLLALGAELMEVDNTLEASGIGQSIAAAVHHTQQASGWLIALADMPFIKASTYKAVCDKARHALANQEPAILAPSFDGARGHPVFFSQTFASSLTALRGDTGAGRVIAQHKQWFETLPVSDPGCLQDIDTPADTPFRLP